MPDDLIPRDAAKAMQLALDHVVELREAWMRGAIRECDGQGGTRSNRNVDVEMALRKALDAIPAAEGVGKAIEEIDDLRCKLFAEGDTAGEIALHTALSILDKHATN